ncbi:ABC transporter permease, partial [archaeon]|nr:ABC transporter permease [archaeon]
MKDYFDLAFGNLKHRGVRSWLTLLGIFIGIAAVVSLISLGSGLKLAVNSQFGVSTTEVITVQAGGVTAFGPPGSGAANPLDVDDMEAIEKLASVERVLRRNIPSGSLEFNDHLIFGLMMNIPDGEDRKFAYETLDVEAEFGRLLKDGDVNKVVLGSNFLEDKVGLEKKVKVGDKILLQEKTFEVVGITKKKGSFIFDNIVHVNEKPLEDLMGYGDDVDVIVVQVKNKDLMEKTKADIEKVLRKTRDVKLGEEDFEVSTPEAALETVNGIISGVQAFIVIIASLSILVGALGIVNTMTASVLERKKEIGIMKAIGARNSDVFMQFFIESGLLGLVGGIIGVVV